MMGIVKRVLTGFVVAVVMAGAAVAGPIEDATLPMSAATMRRR